MKGRQNPQTHRSFNDFYYMLYPKQFFLSIITQSKLDQHILKQIKI